MYNAKAVASNIRNARLFRNYSQDYLGYKLGISQNGYSKIELGQSEISLRRVVDIAAILEVDVNRLIQDPGAWTDIDAINRIPMVPKMLEVVCRITGMGFAAIARVTHDKWVACSVRDEINFGLKPGGELQLVSTICNEIRQSGKGIVIDHVAEDPKFAQHHTPLQYGFQSYISLPVVLKDGSFFGTLCSIDPKPAKVNNAETIGMFQLFAELIAVHLDGLGFYDSGSPAQRKAVEMAEKLIVAEASLKSVG
ncbi:GAF domain-containing protein [Mucilaginibacter antarcticus]|uniref:GAF domain-containing protein n=1 Tax=Mucilaginibacter antarcticus TaxID=1855725 RepID=A0ABW5XJB4_9SPHI